MSKTNAAFLSNTAEVVELLEAPVLQAGVDIARLRQFLPNQPAKGIESGFCVSLDSVLVESDLIPKFDSIFSTNPLFDSDSNFSSDNANSGWLLNGHLLKTRQRSISDAPQLDSASYSGFLAECDLQFSALFTFIETSIDSIQHQLDTRNDSIPVDHYASMSQSSNYSVTSDIQNKLLLSREELRDNALFCDRALNRIRQLKYCLKGNLSQLQNIVQAYYQAFPDEKLLISKFMKNKRNVVCSLAGQLGEYEADIRRRKRYLEARLTVVGWKDLMNPQRKQLTLFALAHFTVFLLAVAALAWFAGYRDRYIGLFYLYRGPMFIILYLYFYSLNLVGWATAHIRYIDIFGFSNPMETPTPYIIFKIAGILSLTFSVFVSALILTVQVEKSDKPERILPLLLWIITIAVLLNPFKKLLHKGRWKLLKVIKRIVLAPFYPVSYGDFWLADQLSSIVVIFLDFEFMICFYTYLWPLDKNENGRVCNGNGYVVRPVISCLPAFWRMMQCLRCYYDSRRYTYLINAVKYFTTFPVVISSSLFTIDGDTSIDLKTREGVVLAIWVVTSLIHAMYTFIWDIYMDWGLFRSSNLLRPTLVYRWKLLYYLAILEDLILRFSWSLKLSLGLQLRAQINLIYTLLSGLEIFRRFVWNFFRVEFEHVSITSQFKEGDKGIVYMESIL